MDDNNNINEGILTKERFIEILARDDEEKEEIHLQDYNYIIKSLVITTDITIIKLACSAIDKSCSRNSSWIIPASSALSNLLAGTSDRSVKISCAQALGRICKLSNLESSAISTLITLLQIAIACNAADRLLIRPLQEGLETIKRPEDNIIVTTDDDQDNNNNNNNSSHNNNNSDNNNNKNSNSNSNSNNNNNNNSDQQTTSASSTSKNGHEAGVMPKRGYSFDLPSDGSIKVTEEQLKTLGSIREHLWKSLRFKLQKFFVAHVTTPQKLELHTFLIHSQVQGLMRLSGFTCNAETDYFSKHHWDRLVDTIDRIYEGKESRLDPYSIDAPRHRRNDYHQSHSSPPRHSSSSASASASAPSSSSSQSQKSSAPPPPSSSSSSNNNNNTNNNSNNNNNSSSNQQSSLELLTDSGTQSYPKYLILQSIPASHADTLDIYDFLKTNHILFGVEKRDIGISLPANPNSDHTAFVRFPTHEDAVTAYNKITNTPYHNKTLHVDYSMTGPARVLFMYKIIRYVTKESIADSLKPFCKQGTIEKVDLPMNSSFGYVTFTEIDDAIRVYQTLLKSSEGGLWIPVADSTCGEHVLVFFKYSKFPDPPRISADHGFKKSSSRRDKAPKNYIIVRVKNLHEHDLTDLESICKRSGECIRLNSLKGSAVYQFTFEESAAAAMTSIKQNLQHCQVQLLDLVEYRHGRVDDFQENSTGGYDPKKNNRPYDDRGNYDNRGGRGRSNPRRDDYPPRSSHRDRSRDRDRDYDYDRNRDRGSGNGRDRDRDNRGGNNNNNNNNRGGDNNNNNTNTNNKDRNNEKERIVEKDKNNNRNREKDQSRELGQEQEDDNDNDFVKHDSRNDRRTDDVEVDYDYDQDKSGENENTPRVERSHNNSWLSKDQDEPEDDNDEQHHRRSRWHDIHGSKDEDDSDREIRKQSDDNDEARKRGRSPSADQDDSGFKKSRGYNERTWQRESDQQQYHGRGRGRGRGRGGR